MHGYNSKFSFIFFLYVFCYVVCMWCCMLLPCKAMVWCKDGCHKYNFFLFLFWCVVFLVTFVVYSSTDGYYTKWYEFQWIKTIWYVCSLITIHITMLFLWFFCFNAIFFCFLFFWFLLILLIIIGLRNDMQSNENETIIMAWITTVTNDIEKLRQFLYLYCCVMWDNYKKE